jgi:hypothetical protein
MDIRVGPRGPIVYAIGFDYLHICVGEMGNTPISIDKP